MRNEAVKAYINYSKEVDYMPGFEVEAETVRAFLIDKALKGVI